MDADEPTPRFRKRWLLYGALGILVLAPVIAWSQRVPIAKQLIDDELNSRGIQADYVLRNVGTSRQRIEKVRIGPAMQPDLTADWIEIDTRAKLFGAEIVAIRALGVRVRGRLIGNKLSLGSLDKLLPVSTDDAFNLPDMDIALRDARMRLDSDYGAIGMRLDGAGNIANSFKGTLAAVAPRLIQGKCSGAQASAFMDIGTAPGGISIKGPLRADKAGCSDVAAQRVLMSIDAAVRPDLSTWSGLGDVVAERLSLPGATLQNVSIRGDFGGTNGQTNGRADFRVGNAAFPGVQARQIAVMGSSRIEYRSAAGLAVEADGQVKGEQVVPDQVLLDRLIAQTRAADGTPVAGIGNRLTSAINGLRLGSAAQARFKVVHEADAGEAIFSGIEARSRSGAVLTFSGADPVRYAWPKGQLQISGQAQLKGGGFPDSQVQLASRGDYLSGTARIAPLVDGATRLVIAPVIFAQSRQGFKVDTRITFDGDMGGVKLTGLDVPIGMRPGASILQGCFPISLGRIAASGFDLDAMQLKTCINGKEAVVAGATVSGRYGPNRFALQAKEARYNLATSAANIIGLIGSGRLGAAPFSLSATSARYSGNKGESRVQDFAITLANGNQKSRLTVQSVTGQIADGRASGQFSGANGALANVPLDMTNAKGRWRYAQDALQLAASLGVSDQASPARFNPLVSNNFELRYAGDRITGQGDLIEPVTGAQIAGLTLNHKLSSTTGNAVLDLGQIKFGNALQPEQLTPITLGVIALVDGGIKGRGNINWSPKGVTSDGRFSTDGLNFAAAFGPVRQMRGEIVFSDLLGLQTPPGQEVRIAEINAGVQVTDGIVRYQLLPGLRTEIETGRWPFSGGELVLEPTILDLSESAERRLTFRVVNLDAAKFINQLQLENISATGTFDGVMPMIFDKNGGRIEAGNLIVREGGGTLSYIGEVSKENLGTWGLIAFDALKSMRYKKLAIDVAGPLDGEMISRVRFDGVNQAEVVPGREQLKLPIPIKVVGLTGIPFIFNIEIRAPFRGLVTMARDFQDPSRVIQQQLENDRLQKERASETQPDKPVQQ